MAQVSNEPDGTPLKPITPFELGAHAIGGTSIDARLVADRLNELLAMILWLREHECACPNCGVGEVPWPWG